MLRPSRTCLLVAPVVAMIALCFAESSSVANAPPVAVPVRPVVPGVLRLHLRERKAAADGKSVQVVERTADWEAAKTAVIVCDMWDDHYCKSAARRVGVMTPRMNAV